MADQPFVEVTRGGIVESIHSGAMAVADAGGNLRAWAGDPERVTFLRSTAKPFQALPLVERGGVEKFGLSSRELAILCASHSGTDEHVAVLRQMQARLKLSEADLQCGAHPPVDRETARRMAQAGEAPTPNRHNCSGKHTGMLALALDLGRETGTSPAAYLDRDGDVQRAILRAFAEMCELDPATIVVGTDGCSAPNFAVPLRSAARALAHLAGAGYRIQDAGDVYGSTGHQVNAQHYSGSTRYEPPVSGYTLPSARAAACRQIVQAMQSHPEMVAGPGLFDTRLMQAARGKLVAKGGAEGYQGVALLPGALGPGSPALGIALKISDGDPVDRARPLVTLEVLRQLGALSEAALAELKAYGTPQPVTNWRGLVVGERRVCFRLEREHA